MPRVVSLGSVNVDHVAHCDAEAVASLAARYDWFPAPGETVRVESIPERVEEYVDETHVGGKGANQSVAAALACRDEESQVDTESIFLGKVGADDAEWAVRDTLAGYAVDVSGVDAADCPTGSAHVFVDESGENYIAIRAGANGRVDPDYVTAHAESLLSADCLLLQNELPVDTGAAALDLVADAHPASRPTVVFDPAPADGAERLVGHPAVDVVTPNESEFAWLSGAADAPGAPDSNVLADFAGVVVRTRGAAELLIEKRETGDVTAITPPPVDPVDTTGAGDVFAGYLAVELAAGRPLPGACRTAVAASALSTERNGVQAATPTWAEVRAFAERVGFALKE